MFLRQALAQTAPQWAHLMDAESIPESLLEAQRAAAEALSASLEATE